MRPFLMRLHGYLVQFLHLFVSLVLLLQGPVCQSVSGQHTFNPLRFLQIVYRDVMEHELQNAQHLRAQVWCKHLHAAARTAGWGPIKHEDPVDHDFPYHGRLAQQVLAHLYCAMRHTQSEQPVLAEFAPHAELHHAQRTPH